MASRPKQVASDIVAAQSAIRVWHLLELNARGHTRWGDGGAFEVHDVLVPKRPVEHHPSETIPHGGVHVILKISKRRAEQCYQALFFTSL
jgi:hypothetical protein